MLQPHKPSLDTFEVVEVRTGDLDLGGKFARQLAALNGIMSYRLRDAAAVPRLPPDRVLTVHALRREGPLRPCYNEDSYATDIEIIGDGQPDLYGFVMLLSGAAEMATGPNGTATVSGSKGIILRGLPGTRVLTTDNTARMVLWLESARLERTLAARLGEPPRRGLVFSPTVDWAAGPAAAVGRMIIYLYDELRDPHGIMSEPVARETFADLLSQCVLHRLEHNYSLQLERPVAAAVPRQIRRAEAFMHASVNQPITLADVATAAGCSLGTLQAAFRRFRETTALRALHDIRLQHARVALFAADDSESTSAIARRFGFTNLSRFIAAYGRRFGERPNEARRRAARQ